MLKMIFLQTSHSKTAKAVNKITILKRLVERLAVFWIRSLTRKVTSSGLYDKPLLSKT